MKYTTNPNAKFSDLLSASIIEEQSEIKTIPTTCKPKETLEDVMKDLEYKVNPKTVEEAIDKVIKSIKMDDSSVLLAPMESGAKEFESRVGRPMTYGEMRAMWG